MIHSFSCCRSAVGGHVRMHATKSVARKCKLFSILCVNTQKKSRWSECALQTINGFVAERLSWASRKALMGDKMKLILGHVSVLDFFCSSDSNYSNILITVNLLPIIEGQGHKLRIYRNSTIYRWMHAISTETTKRKNKKKNKMGKNQFIPYAYTHTRNRSIINRVLAFVPLMKQRP